MSLAVYVAFDRGYQCSQVDTVQSYLNKTKQPDLMKLGASVAYLPDNFRCHSKGVKFLLQADEGADANEHHIAHYPNILRNSKPTGEGKDTSVFVANQIVKRNLKNAGSPLMSVISVPATFSRVMTFLDQALCDANFRNTGITLGYTTEELAGQNMGNLLAYISCHTVTISAIVSRFLWFLHPLILASQLTNELSGIAVFLSDNNSPGRAFLRFRLVFIEFLWENWFIDYYKLRETAGHIIPAPDVTNLRKVVMSQYLLRESKYLSTYFDASADGIVSTNIQFEHHDEARLTASQMMVVIPDIFYKVLFEVIDRWDKGTHNDMPNSMPFDRDAEGKEIAPIFTVDHEVIEELDMLREAIAVSRCRLEAWEYFFGEDQNAAINDKAAMEHEERLGCYNDYDSTTLSETYTKHHLFRAVIDGEPALNWLGFQIWAGVVQTQRREVPSLPDHIIRDQQEWLSKSTDY